MKPKRTTNNTSKKENEKKEKKKKKAVRVQREHGEHFKLIHEQQTHTHTYVICRIICDRICDGGKK